MHFRAAPVSLAFALLAVSACTTQASTQETTTTTTISPGLTTTTAAGTTTSTSSQPLPEHRIQVRVVDDEGEFYDTATGQRFVPRGMNYNRFLPSATGPIYDSVLATPLYDPATVDADLAEMRSMGFNVVRIMIETCGVYIDGCITGPDGRLNPAYIDNLVDFLNRAKAADLVVMIASNTLPDDSYWIHETAALVDEAFDSANNEFLNPAAIPFYADYWQSVVQALVDRNAPLDAIWAYELRQEHHFHLDYAPLSLGSGFITTANGKTYDMASQADKDRMIDEGLVYWADLLRDAIREIDPTAPVTVGFFTPNAPHQVLGPDETRLVRTAYFLRNSSMDFVDLHHYPGNGLDDNDIWENFGIEGAGEMPVVLGEFGGYRTWWSNAAQAASAVMGMEVDSCRVGFDGWLVWAWRGDESQDLWWATEGAGEIAQVVSPLERPDPCEYGRFGFIRFNLATGATVTASSAIASNPPEYAIDESPSYWNAVDGAPGWIELALSEPADIEEIRLVVAQYPAGPSRHELWVQRTGGALEMVHVFEGSTGEGDVLVFEPEEALIAVEKVRVVTTSLGDLAPAWHEVELLTSTPPG